ncbi:leucine-rich repeat domain-containing protein [Capnocytophaga canimorsus]|uniref:leucine-rich repeat domain-containing protein n=1 Tax=Capnocytophaga canimorsus TaxID=28188 RepID=UPI003859BEEC
MKKNFYPLVAVFVLIAIALWGCKKDEDETPKKTETTEEVVEEEPLKQQDLVIELPASVDAKVVEQFVVANAYGEFKLVQQVNTGSTNRPTHNLYNSSYNYSGNGLILNSVLDINKNPLMMFITDSAEKRKVTIAAAEDTAISLLMLQPEFITSNKEEFDALASSIKALPEFEEYRNGIAAEMERAIKKGIAPNYENVKQGRVMVALLAKTFENFEITQNGVTIDRSSVKRNNGKFEFTVTNNLKRILHMYPKKVYMQDNGLGIKSEEYLTYKFAGMETPLPDIHVLNSESVSYWKIVKGSLFGDRSSIYKKTSDVINVDIGDADKLHYEVYGIGSLDKPFSQYTKEEQFRIVLVGIHGGYNDFLKPVIDLALGLENVESASGKDDYKYDFRYGARKEPLRALINKLSESFVKNPSEMKKMADNNEKMKTNPVEGTFNSLRQIVNFCIDEIFENKNNEDKRTYINLLYNIYKNTSKTSKTSDAFREGLKSFSNQITHIKKANFAGKVIEVSELTLDVGGAVYAALTTSAKTDFWFDREQEAYLSFKSPTAGAVVNPKSVRLEWELLRGKKVAEIRYEVSIKATQADGQIKQKVFADLVESTLLLDLITELKAEDIVSVQCKVTAKHARNSSNIIAESDNETFVVGAAPIDVPEGVVIENNILRKWPCDKIPADGKVVIPNGIVRIDYGAFNSCQELKSIVIPNSVSYIASSAFSGTKLTAIKLPRDIRIVEGGAFSGCSDLVSVTLPEGVVKIENEAFQHCKNLKVINIPASVVSIGERAFLNCTSLKSIIIPSGIAVIQGEAFANTGLTSITIPGSIKNIGQRAFASNGALNLAILEEGVVNIGTSAFAGCHSLISVTLPNSINSIGNRAFESNRSLTAITLPENLTTINRNTFSGCNSLLSITIPKKVTNIDSYAFENCSSLNEVSFPEGLKAIGYGSFRSCNNLTSIVLPSSVTTIEGEAFNCKNLASVTIKAETPPNIHYPFYSSVSFFVIKVPAGSVDAYKNASIWRNYNIIAQ